MKILGFIIGIICVVLFITIFTFIIGVIAQVMINVDLDPLKWILDKAEIVADKICDLLNERRGDKS